MTLQVSDEAEQETSLPDGVGLPPNGGAFQVHLDNFDGPFDLLLQLISRHKMDITEVALSQVTDEFIAHIKAAGSAWDLDQTSQFVLVAATLLDLKAARLIPSGEVEDRRTWHCWRLEICCSRGCCSIAPSSASPAISLRL